MTKLTHANGAPVVDNFNILTAGERGPALLQDIWLLEKLAHFDHAGLVDTAGLGQHLIIRRLHRRDGSQTQGKNGEKTLEHVQTPVTAGKRPQAASIQGQRIAKGCQRRKVCVWRFCSRPVQRRYTVCPGQPTAS